MKTIPEQLRDWWEVLVKGESFDPAALRVTLIAAARLLEKLPVDHEGNPISPGMDIYSCGGRLRARATMHLEAWWDGPAFNDVAFRSFYASLEASIREEIQKTLEETDKKKEEPDAPCL